MPNKKKITKEDQENKIKIGNILWNVFFITVSVACCVWILTATIKTKIYILTALWILLLLFVVTLAIICFYEDLSDEEKKAIKKTVKRIKKTVKRRKEK